MKHYHDNTATLNRLVNLLSVLSDMEYELSLPGL